VAANDQEMNMNKLTKAVSIISLAVAILPNVAFAQSDESWEFGLSIYGWFPDISGETSFPDGSGGDFTIPVSNILDNLQFTFQGAFEARKGHWGVVTDVIYMDLGNTKKDVQNISIGRNDIPADVTAKIGLDVTSWIWTAAGYYRFVDEPQMSFDLLGGVRYLDLNQTLKWSFSEDIEEIPLPGREGSAKVSGSSWDAIIGMRGRFSFGPDNKWFIPYYLDVGTGDSDLTWQVFGGIGYAFSWGEVAAAWRYLEYDMPASGLIADMDFSGPLLGATFRW
jgi:hypothetical protein